MSEEVSYPVLACATARTVWQLYKVPFIAVVGIIGLFTPYSYCVADIAVAVWATIESVTASRTLRDGLPQDGEAAREHGVTNSVWA